MNKRVLSRSMFNRTARNKLYNKGGLPSVQKFQFGGMPRNLPRPGGGIELRYPFISDMIRKGDVAGLTNILTTAQKNPMTSTMYGGTPVQRPNPLIDIAQGGIESINKRPEPKQSVALTQAEKLNKLFKAEEVSPVLKELNLSGQTEKDLDSIDNLGSEKEILKTGKALDAVQSEEKVKQKSETLKNEISELKNNKNVINTGANITSVIPKGEGETATSEEQEFVGAGINKTIQDLGNKYNQSVNNINAGETDPKKKVNALDEVFANKVLTAFGVTDTEKEAEDKTLKQKTEEYTALIREVLGDDAAKDKTLSGLNLAMFGFAMASGESPNALTNIGKAGMKYADAASKTVQAKKARDEKIALLGLGKAFESENSKIAFEQSLKKIAFGEQFKFAYQVYDNEQKADRLATQLAAVKANTLDRISSNQKIAQMGIDSREKLTTLSLALQESLNNKKITSNEAIASANITSRENIAALNQELSLLNIDAKFSLQDSAQAFQEKLNNINNELKTSINNANNEASLFRTIRGNFDSSAEAVYSMRNALGLEGDDLFKAKILKGKVIQPGEEGYSEAKDFLEQLGDLASTSGASSNTMKTYGIDRIKEEIIINPEKYYGGTVGEERPMDTLLKTMIQNPEQVFGSNLELLKDKKYNKVRGYLEAEIDKFSKDKNYTTPRLSPGTEIFKTVRDIYLGQMN